jgi:hypothetical protein
MLPREKVVVCSEINTQHINSVLAEYTVVEFQPVGASSRL